MCSTLSSPTNGAVRVNSLFVDGTATYACDPEYDLVGASSCTCQSTGSWSSSPPTCDGESNKHLLYTLSRSRSER